MGHKQTTEGCFVLFLFLPIGGIRFLVFSEIRCGFFFQLRKGRWFLLARAPRSSLPQLLCGELVWRVRGLFGGDR